MINTFNKSDINWQIAFIFRTGGSRTSFYQLNCDPLEFSLYTPSPKCSRNLLPDTPGKWLYLQTTPWILVSNYPTPWISAVFFTPPPGFSKAFFTPLQCLQPPSVWIINAICQFDNPFYFYIIKIS